MKTTMKNLTRRQALAATGSAALVLGLGTQPGRAAEVALRQGYQTNMWGMPTYYLMKSGLLEKAGMKVQDFAVPSGNLTMQQMVARQVDLGTYAGPSFIIGYDKGGLIAVAVIERVGKTIQVMARKDLGLKKIEDLRGKKVANQTGSSTGNIFTDELAPKHGLKKGDYQEVRMNVNDMVSAMAAKTVDAMVSVEPYNAIAAADGIANTLINFTDVDPLPVFMAATPDFVDKNPDAIVAYLKAWLQVADDFKNRPDKVADVIYSFYTSKGYKMSRDTFKQALSAVEVDPGFPDLKAYMQHHAQVLLEAKKIKAIPDWSKALRPDFMTKAKAGA
jgi:ABC-type nitrate/sulfonate/bicarbonate transport system substrate-binding protein